MRELNSWSRPIALCFVICSCQAKTETSEIEFENLNIQNIVAQTVDERIWPTKAVGQKLVQVPAAIDNPLVSPACVVADRNGYFYVADDMDYKIKKFDAAGGFIRSIGAGQGEGPGEIATIRSWGILGDSTIYVLDLNQRINFYQVDGSAFRTENLQSDFFTPKSGLAITSSGRKYFMISGGNNRGEFFETKWQGDTEPFGVLQGESGWKQDIPLYGRVVPFRESMVYVPTVYPLVVQFTTDGTVKYARTTLDYGVVEEPEFFEYAPGRKRVFSETLADSFPSVDGDRLFVHAALADAIDVYDAESGDYLYSAKLPQQVTDAHVQNERLYVVDNQGVSVWAMPYAM